MTLNQIMIGVETGGQSFVRNYEMEDVMNMDREELGEILEQLIEALTQKEMPF